MTRAQAINDYCKWCIYDPLDQGTWRMQVEKCTVTDCPLYPYRPLPKYQSKSDGAGKTHAKTTTEEENNHE